MNPHSSKFASIFLTVNFRGALLTFTSINIQNLIKWTSPNLHLCSLAIRVFNSEKDFRLTAKDVEGIKLDADLVVLSACHTAHGTINSEGVIGLARAFQVAGARSIVTALWAIPDNATKKFMEEFYANLCFGHPVADAIRTTQVKMSASEEFYDLINWGSFKVFGANARIMEFSQPKN